MRIVHHLGVSSSPEASAFFGSLGLASEEGGGIITLDVDEEDARWPAVRDWAIEHEAFHSVRTEFTAREIAGAEWLALSPSWHHGYPQPEGDFGYLSVTYDRSRYCEACGIGAVQAAPFRMSREPRWGRRSILQLNWVFDEYFVTPSLWTEVLKPLGVRVRPVQDVHGRELRSVLQLAIDDGVELSSGTLPGEACGRCGRVKFPPHVRGPFPALRTAPTGAIARTREYFGSGASAHNVVLVSKRLVRGLMDAKAKGASFTPVAST